MTDDRSPSGEQQPQAHRPVSGAAGTPGRRPVPRWRRARPAVLTGLAVLLVVIAGLLAVLYQLTPPSATPRQVTFEVKPGWGGKEVAGALAEQGLVRNARIFELYLRARHLDRSIGEGLYDLSPAMSAPQVAAALKRGGRPRTLEVVVPEGWRATDIARRLARDGLGSAADYLALVRHPGDLRPGFVPAGDGLEGYLFPASYAVPVKSSPHDVLDMMLERFHQELTTDVESRLRARGLSVHAWVTLASMVQAEAASSGEMPIIAGVFLNRLDLGMPLQSDPTVAYGLGKALPDLKPEDLHKDTPWNTYTRAGLPEGPIDNPGDAALQSVLDPVRTNALGKRYLYFLHAQENGKTVFRPNTSLEAHNQDVRRYLQGPAP